jgi:hypothetical protein
LSLSLSPSEPMETLAKIVLIGVLGWVGRRELLGLLRLVRDVFREESEDDV